MKIHFTKMQGAGNDYVYINALQYPIEHPEKAAIRLSDRHFGIGSDGLVLIMPSDTCDFRMRMFNADGSEAQMCGNASRCIGKYVYEKGLTDKTQFTLETLSGVKHLSLTVQDKTVKEIEVDMGKPVLTPAEIPVLLPEVDEGPLPSQNPLRRGKTLRQPPFLLFSLLNHSVRYGHVCPDVWITCITKITVKNHPITDAWATIRSIRKRRDDGE